MTLAMIWIFFLFPGHVNKDVILGGGVGLKFFDVCFFGVLSPLSGLNLPHHHGRLGALEAPWVIWEVSHPPLLTVFPGC